MSTPGVVFDGVWKRFRRGEIHNSLRDLIPALGRGLFTRRGPSDLESPNDFWAVRDASFAVGPGEALGIIGANGAGKSTTLKLLTRILKPTRGHCAVKGRVGALIEVAAGFHPDLTGRENIYLQGAIMGMKRREIRTKLDAIVDFAGVEAFLDTPIKRYSSGMNARLGFSIAAHMDPDVLLIDEVLAVGDLAFQERCYERMQEFRRSGAAIVFVSHNLAAVASVCDNVALFDHGRILTIGPPAETFTTYAGRGDATTANGSLRVMMSSGEPIGSEVSAGGQLRVTALLLLPATEGKIAFSLRIKRIESGQYVYLTTTPSLGCQPIQATEQTTIHVKWQFRANVSRGHYIVEVAAFELAQRRELMVVASMPFAVREQESEQGTAYVGSSCEVSITESSQTAAIA